MENVEHACTDAKINTDSILDRTENRQTTTYHHCEKQVKDLDSTVPSMDVNCF